MRSWMLAAALLVVGCAREPSPSHGTTFDAHGDTYRATVSRIDPSAFEQGPCIASLRNGQPVNQGDCLIFAGLAMYGLPCAAGQRLADATKAMLATGAYTVKTDLDGLLGIYRGIVKRATVCGDTAWPFPAPPAGSLPAEFGYMKDVVGWKLGIRGKPTADRQAVLEFEVVGWAKADVAARAAAYRLNLALITFQTLQEAGLTISQFGHDEFCKVTSGAIIPTIDQWCGRGTLGDYLTDFRYDVWQYRHQRSGAWEAAPDGDGDSQPGVDYVVGFSDLYGSQK